MNDYPRLHITLDFIPGRLMNKATGFIQSAVYGARFEIGTGKYVWDLCRGDLLASLPIQVVNGEIILQLSIAVDVAQK